MSMEIIAGIFLPLLGTSLGAACVLFMKASVGGTVRKILTGFAAGVMTAASVWSLLLPALEQSKGMGRWSFLPALAGLWSGIVFFLLERFITNLYRSRRSAASSKTGRQKTDMLMLAVTLHNIPEGMAVGAAYAGYLSGNVGISAMAAFVVSAGIAIQNFPEGAIVSMPLKAKGISRKRAFCCGVLSGIVEPMGAFLTILATRLIVPALPYLLSFAAGAMLYVVVEELLPEAAGGKHTNAETIFFAVGFSVMMVMDVAFG